MRRLLTILLAFNAGFVDTAGFLALHGLFTTHVTGNFVTFGAALVHGASGALAKLLALPLFCAVIALVRYGRTPLVVMLAVQTALLGIGAAVAWVYGPFPNGDAPLALAVGGALVAAMAIQNAAHRTHLTATPATTVMTLTTTQVMVDVADLVRGLDQAGRATLYGRLGPMTLGIAVFALGCAVAAAVYALAGARCLAVPPAVAAMALLAHLRGRSG